MPNNQLSIATFIITVATISANVSNAQSYPSKPVRIVTSQAGSGDDFASRLLSPGLSQSMGQQFVTDNRGINGIPIVADAPADGYTLLIYGSAFWYSPYFHDDVTWNPIRDFAPITLCVGSPSILVVNPNLPVKSVQELIALAKARPGELNYGSASTGSALHLAAELFKAMAGVNIVRVPYKGNSQAINALVSNEVQIVFSSAGVVMPHVKSGRLRALAASSAEPSPLAPGLPTVAASGLPGFESVTMVGVFAPARTPTDVINRLNREIVQDLRRPEIKERLFNAGVEAVGNTPAQFAEKMKFEMNRMSKVIKDANIHSD